MQNGYYQATGAMVTQFNRLNLISNNLANLNTIGFKKDDVIIGDFERIFKDTRDELELKNHTKDAAKFINRNINRIPIVVQEFTNFSQGALKQSNNKLDFAIKNNDLFFLLQTPDGIRLSKNGSFSLNENGYLVNKDGFKVLESGYENKLEDQRGIKINDVNFTSDKQGNFYSNNEIFSKLFIARPQDIRNLTKVGDNLYSIKDMEDLKEDESEDSVMQGYQEASNVNAVIEMSALIETNRLVEMYQKVMNSQMNDLNQDTINKLANIKV